MLCEWEWIRIQISVPTFLENFGMFWIDNSKQFSFYPVDIEIEWAHGMYSLLVLLYFELVFFGRSNVPVMFVVQNGEIPFFVFVRTQVVNG